MPHFSFSRPGLSRPGAGGRPRTPIRGLPVVLAAGLALTASACMSPAAKQSSSAAETADRQAAAKGNRVDPGSKSGAGGESAKPRKPWWRLSKYNRPADFKVPWELDGLREGPGLLSKDPDGFVLLRKGEGKSSDPSKPTKARRR